MTALPRLVRRRSPISGWGVYADQPIAEDTRIVEYKGELVSQAEGWRREKRYLPRQRIWIFTVNDRWVRDAAVGGNIARYINHACSPNCYVDVVKPDDLDSRLAPDPQGRRVDLRLQHGWRRRHPLSLPSALPPDPVTASDTLTFDM